MILLLANAALAQDVNTVLLPDITPESVSDYSVAIMLTDQLKRDLEAHGLVVIGGPELVETVGEAADGCADTPECPNVLWEHFDAPMALVGELSNTDAGLDVTVAFHQPAEASAIADYNEVIFPGAEFEYTAVVADKTVDLLKLLSMFELTDPIVEIEPVEHEDPYATDPVDPIEDPVDPVETDPIESDPVTGLFVDNPVERRGMGINKRNYEAYALSGMGQEEWLADRRVRAGSFFFEIGGGIIMGSVDRSYDVELALDEQDDGSFVETARYEEDVLVGGVGGQGGVAVGVNIASRVDLLLSGGIQSGRKHLRTGWEHYLDGDFVQDSEDEPPAAAAAVGWASPRVRVYFLQTGLVKPYVLGAADIRFYDAYEVEDTSDVISYQPGRPPLYPVSVGAGGGLMVDFSDELAVFVEPSWNQMVYGADAYRKTTDALSTSPDASEAITSSIRITAGLGVKF